MQRKTRVDLNPELAQLVADIAREQRVGEGEAIKRALALVKYLQEQERDGATIEIHDKDGDVKQLKVR
jgi:hypothetical protein